MDSAPDLVLSPDQAAEVEAPGVGGHAVWSHAPHHQHEAVTGPVTCGVVKSHQRSRVVIARARSRALFHRTGQHLCPAALGDRISEMEKEEGEKKSVQLELQLLKNEPYTTQSQNYQVLIRILIQTVMHQLL